jgi:hypothetical protein
VSSLQSFDHLSLARATEAVVILLRHMNYKLIGYLASTQSCAKSKQNQMKRSCTSEARFGAVVHTCDTVTPSTSCIGIRRLQEEKFVGFRLYTALFVTTMARSCDLSRLLIFRNKSENKTSSAKAHTLHPIITHVATFKHAKRGYLRQQTWGTACGRFQRLSRRGSHP